jgi:hypothetical protein
MELVETALAAGKTDLLQPENAKPVANAPHIAYRPGLDGLRASRRGRLPLSRPDRLAAGRLPRRRPLLRPRRLPDPSLLLVEWEARNRIDLRRFWLRRARRSSALVVVVLASLASPRSSPARTSPTREACGDSLLYYTTGTRSSRTTRTSA